MNTICELEAPALSAGYEQDEFVLSDLVHAQSEELRGGRLPGWLEQAYLRPPEKKPEGWQPTRFGDAVAIAETRQRLAVAADKPEELSRVIVTESKRMSEVVNGLLDSHYYKAPYQRQATSRILDQVRLDQEATCRGHA